MTKHETSSNKESLPETEQLPLFDVLGKFGRYVIILDGIVYPQYDGTESE